MNECNIVYSIIMPVYNSGQFLDIAVKSILNQDFNDFELILVDDGSSDGSSERCDFFAEQDERVVVIHQQNRGMGFARNKAIKTARGQYIGFCDHDDEFMQSCLSRCFEIISKEKVDVIKFGCKELYLKWDNIIRTRELTYRENKLFKDGEQADAFLYKFDCDYMAYIWDGFYKKELFCSGIFFNEDMRTGYEDEDVLVRIFEQMKSIFFMNEIYYIHNIRQELSSSKKHNNNQLNAMYTALNAEIKVSSNLGVPQLDPAFPEAFVGKNLETAFRCIVYDLKSKPRLKAKEIYDTPVIRNHLKKYQIRRVFEKKSTWGVLYTLFSMRMFGVIDLLARMFRIKYGLKKK